MTNTHIFDPKGLIYEAYAIEGIAAPECRSIFLDWALSLPADRDTQKEIRLLLAHYATKNDAGHPMTQTLTQALEQADAPRRKGGRKARVS